MSNRKPKRSNEQSRSRKFRMSTVERLSTPKAVHPNVIPNKPSVYWLDYIETNDSLHLRTPVQLNEYYNRFYTKQPRLKNLSRPKTCLCDPSESPPRTASGIPVSALNYCASPRIKLLAQPRYYGESGANRLPSINKATTSTDDGPKSRNKPRKISRTTDQFQERCDPKKISNTKETGRERFLHGGDAPSAPLEKYSRVPINKNSSQPPHQSHSTVFEKRSQTPTVTANDTGLKKRDFKQRSRTTLPPLVNSKNEESQQRKLSRKKRSNTKLPGIYGDTFY